MNKDVIDIEDVLERVQDDKELFLELLDIFIEDYGKKRESLSLMLEAADFEQIKDLVHSVKGATGNISAKAMHASCIHIEELIMTEDIEGIKKAVAVMDQQQRELQDAIVKIKQDFAQKA